MSFFEEFEKSVFGSVSLILGKRTVGKTSLALDLILREFERMKDEEALIMFPKIVIGSEYEHHRKMYENELPKSKQIDLKFCLDYHQIIEMIDNQEYNSSLVVIEDDLQYLDSFMNDQIALKAFLDNVRRRNITVIMIIQNLGKIASTLSSSFDFLFLFNDNTYSDLQKIHSRFLSNLSFSPFLKITRDVNLKSNQVLVIDVSPDNYRRKLKLNKKQTNIIGDDQLPDIFYLYSTDKEVSDSDSDSDAGSDGSLSARDFRIEQIKTQVNTLFEIAKGLKAEMSYL